jgi:hypothetical protein
MKTSPFVLNKVNFDTYTSNDVYTSCFMKIVPIRRLQLVHDTPYSISNDIQQHKTSLSTLIRLCKWKRCNVWIVTETICYHIGEFPPTHVVEDNTVIEWNHQVYVNHYHILHPMYALSHYKLNDLRTIALSMKMPIEKKTKQHLYEEIQSVYDSFN